MEEYVVYILWSEKTDKIYTGFTSSLIQRFRCHNELGNKGWTVRFRPWKVVFVKVFDTKIEAMLFEKFLKTGVGREWMAKNIEFPLQGYIFP